MTIEKQYIRATTCFTGEVDKFGYAFVPGNNAGVVLMDKRSRALLEDLSIYQPGSDDDRLRLLLGNGLIHEIDFADVGPGVCEETCSISTWLHITNGCNLDCPYCYIKKDDGRMTIAIIKAYMDKLEETFVRHSLRSVAIRISGGEPTLEREMVEYVIQELYSRFQSRTNQILPVIITNGTLINEWWVEFINKYNVGVGFSLDGLGQWHDRTRFFKNGRGSFQTVFRNLELCLRSKIRFNILTTITEDNIDGIEELNRYLVDNDLNFRYGIYRDAKRDYRNYCSFVDKLKSVLGYCYDYYARAITERRAQF